MEMGSSPSWKDLTQVHGLVLGLCKGFREMDDGKEGEEHAGKVWMPSP